MRRSIASLALLIALPSFGLVAARGEPDPGAAQLEKLVAETLPAADRQVAFLLTQIPQGDVLPRSFENGKLVLIRSGDWTSGFFPGSLWYLFEATGMEKWRGAAAHYTALLEREQQNRGTHDLGFMLYCSYGNGLRLTGERRYRDVLMNAAAALSTRFNPRVGAIRSWDGAAWSYPVIIDNMMNLELLLWASHEGPIGRYREIALTHADTTLANHFRPDGSTFHLVDYDPADGRVLRRQTYQGASDASTWARGQAWAIYSCTRLYRMTRDRRYLAQAEKSSNFVINHPRLPADHVPFWDFDAATIPDAPRDSAAAAVLCSGLFDLAGCCGPADGKKYADFAAATLRSLASPAYLAKFGTNGGFLLRHATGNLPHGQEIDVPLNYADYYFLESLVRARSWLDRGSAAQGSPAQGSPP